MAAEVERKGIWLWAVAVALSAAIAAALGWAAAASTMAGKAADLDSVDLALGSVAVTRASAAQAVITATNHTAGTASSEALGTALSDLAANAVAYRQLALEADVAPVLADAALAIGVRLQNGDVDDARSELEGPLQETYRADLAALTLERDRVVAEIGSASSLAAAAAGWLRIAGVIAIPLLIATVVYSAGRRRQRAERAQLLEVVREVGVEASAAGSLLSDISHRLRTPLTSIFGLSELLAQSKRVSGLERELASLIHAEAAELQRVADDVLVLDQMRKDTLRPSPEIFALPDLLENATKSFRSAGVEIKIESPEVWVLSDPVKVRHIVRNLVANAASHGGAPIFVEASEVDGRVECVVIDHGPGLPVEIDLSTGNTGGHGHGLEIAHQLSRSIGAALTHGREGDQTRFTLSFGAESPAGPADAAPA